MGEAKERSIFRSDEDCEVFLNEQIEIVKTKVKGRAITALSGGVDSMTAATIVAKAIGANQQAVFVDNGYMRKNEPAQVYDMSNACEINIKVVDAVEEFLDATLEEPLQKEFNYKLPLKETSNPEIKRKIIGGKFIRVFEREARIIGAKYLVQGTIAPDWIESGGGLKDNIKSHHNVGGLPPDMKVELVEPLRDLYKSDVYRLIKYLDLPIKRRQPFPGPGLAIRVLGKANKENTEVVREACHIVETEIEAASKARKMERPWQYFACYAPDVKTVGVHGDVRAYLGSIFVRAVDSQDAMTAQASKIPYGVQERISTQITNTLHDKVGRVFFDMTHKPPGTVEYE
jgi:GMP synthase (glutamine-hydrolysing)